MWRDVDWPKGATKSRAHLQAVYVCVWSWIEGEEITTRRRSGKKKEQERWCEENEVELRGAHTRGVHTWENGTRSSFGPVSLTPGIFRAFISTVSDACWDSFVWLRVAASRIDQRDDYCGLRGAIQNAKSSSFVSSSAFFLFFFLPVRREEISFDRGFGKFEVTEECRVWSYGIYAWIAKLKRGLVFRIGFGSNVW